MGRTRTVLVKDLRLRIRDRSAILIAVVAPFVIASIIGLALGSTQDFKTKIAYANLSKSPLTDGLTQALTSREFAATAAVVVQASEEDVERAVVDGKANAGIVVPAGFVEAVLAGEAADIVVISDPNSPVSASIAEGVAQAFLSRVQAGQVAVATVVSLEGREPTDPGAIGGQAAEGLASVVVRRDPVTGGLRPIDYFAPAMGIMFLYFTVLYGATTLHAERRDHTFARLAVSAARPTEVLAGKLLAIFAVGLLEMAVLIVSTSVVYDVPWGNPVLLAVLVLTTTFSAIGITGVVVVLTRTEEQSRQVGTAIIVVLTLLGGQWAFGALPGGLTALQQITPNGQALLGFTDLMVSGSSATAGTILVPVLVTIAYGLAGFAITGLRARAVFLA